MSGATLSAVAGSLAWMEWLDRLLTLVMLSVEPLAAFTVHYFKRTSNALYCNIQR